MKPSTRRVLWVGIALVVIPTALLLAIIGFQPREYQSSVFIEVGRPAATSPLPVMSREDLYAILFLIGIYLPGVTLLIIALISWRRQLRVTRHQTT